MEINSSFTYRINLYYQNLNFEDEGDEDFKDNGKCKGKNKYCTEY